MNEQQVNELTVTLKALAASQLKQAEAINRLAQADETLVSLIAKTLVDEIDDTDDELLPQTYLNGKPR
ncbi:hypothetical protein K3P68_000300 [Escherichia coli]|nr:hypothetical protein [Escherichia coli]